MVELTALVVRYQILAAVFLFAIKVW